MKCNVLVVIGAATGDWFKVPDGINIEDFPEVWTCEMRLWDHPGDKGYPREFWCRKPNHRYIKQLKAAI
jgi:hypothetical protein